MSIWICNDPISCAFKKVSRTSFNARGFSSFMCMLLSWWFLVPPVFTSYQTAAQTVDEASVCKRSWAGSWVKVIPCIFRCFSPNKESPIEIICSVTLLFPCSSNNQQVGQISYMHIPILLKRVKGIFKNFVKTYGAGARSKHRHRNWYSVPSHQNITLFWRKEMYWFNSFKLITGLLPPSFFFTINVLLRNWSLCGQGYSIAPYFTRFSTSNEASAFSCISKFICFGFRLFFFGLLFEWNSISPY